MNDALQEVDLWFKRNKLNLNPSKTRYMLFNVKTRETDLVKIGNEYLQRVWKEGKETSFKLVGIEVDEDLSWSNHIQVISRKINSDLYGLAKLVGTLIRKIKNLCTVG